MPWGVVAAAVIGGVASNQAAKKGANASNNATAATIQEQREAREQARQDQLPWLQTGGWALDRQRAFLNGDLSGFQNAPDYKFAVEQGFKGLERGAAANAGLTSGGADADRIALGQGLATQFAGNYWAKLAGLSGTGQQSAQNLGGQGMAAASNMGNALMANGAQRMSLYAQQGANYANTANQFGQAYMYWNQNRAANSPSNKYSNTKGG